jgi:CubicO group peptidase (beta-lactamase class C family)
MRPLFTALVIFLVTTGLGNLAEALVCSESELHRKIKRIADAEARYDLFSGAVLVAHDGKIVYEKGFGYANKEYHVPNTSKSQYNISSIQKSFIATVIMQLCQENRISLEDPLIKYFPDCSFETADRIQIKHLLNHTSGLGEYRDSEEYRTHSESYTCIDDVLPLIFNGKPAFPPGERFRYSNAGVLLLKAIIERVEGKGLQQVLDIRIFGPLEMEGTKLFKGGDLLPHRATAYEYDYRTEAYKRVLGEPSAYAGGGIYTSTQDLLKFDNALYGDKLLDEESRALMFTPWESNPNYAYGWEIATSGGTKVVYHGGGSGGFSSSFRRYPDIGYTLVVLSNYRGAAYDLADKIEAVLLGTPYTLATEADSLYKHAMYFQEQADYRKAIEIFNNYVEQTPPHLPSLYQSARSRILGEFEQEKAIELLDMYIDYATKSTRPSIAAAWWRKGVAREQLGQVSKAVDCYRKCLDLDPGFEYAHEALERIAPERQ